MVFVAMDVAMSEVVGDLPGADGRSALALPMLIVLGRELQRNAPCCSGLSIVLNFCLHLHNHGQSI